MTGEPVFSRATGLRYRYLRDWAPGDPREAKGRSLWEDSIGQTWLSPAEVRAAGLTEAMREAIESGPVTEPEQEARSSELRPPTEGDVSAVPAEEWFESAPEEPGALPPAPPREERVRPPDAGDGRYRPTEAQREAAEAWRESRAELVRGLEADPVPEPLPSGESGGWRWWWAEDGGETLLAYDNRPAMDRWVEDQIAACRDLEAGRPPREVAAVSPRLVQGVIPLSVVEDARAALARGARVRSWVDEEGRVTVRADWPRDRSVVWACPACGAEHPVSGEEGLDCACGARWRFDYDAIAALKARLDRIHDDPGEGR